MQSIFDILYTHWSYLIILLVSLAGLLAADWRWRLIAFSPTHHKKQTELSPRLRALRATFAAMLSFFLVWDICGIALGIFRTNPSYTVGLNLFTSNLPIEEVLFLVLLTYVSLLTYAGITLYINKRVQP